MNANGSIEMQVESCDVSIVTLYGEHDLASTTQVDIALALARESPNVIVDLSHATFIDSCVINALLRAWKVAQRRGGVFEVVVAPEGRLVRRALELSGVQPMLRIHTTVDEGIASVRVAPRDESARRRTRDLGTVTARIDALHATHHARRARLEADSAGVVIRAAVSGDEPAPRRVA